jgi:hypothetical protein
VTGFNRRSRLGIDDLVEAIQRRLCGRGRIRSMPESIDDAQTKNSAVPVKNPGIAIYRLARKRATRTGDRQR